jgi:hypothetical protein
MTMKVIELLKKKLPIEYVQAIVRNAERPSDLFEEAEDIEVELMSLFDWSNTKEGFEFWSDVFNSVIEGTKLPNIKKVSIIYLPGTVFFTKNQVMMYNIADMDINLKFDYEPSMVDMMSELVEESYYTWMN